MFLLLTREYDDEGLVSATAFAASKHKSKIEKYLDDLLKTSIEYDEKFQEYELECINIIKSYLLNNYDAITGWNDVRQQIATSYPITDSEKNSVIEYLSKNYYFSKGKKNIVEIAYNNSLIPKYCDINKLKRPYPRLPEYPPIPTPYYKRQWFYIEEVKDLDE
jgi:hypothetical protein